MRNFLRTVLLVLSAFALTSGCTTTQRTGPGSGGSAEQEPFEAYLLVHFTGESPMGEQVYFAVSEDGLNWTDLNNSAPVLTSTIGEMGVRDPAIVRSPDGDGFFLLATDLRIASGHGWHAAQFDGSTSLVFWESSDLLNWSDPWMVDVAGSIPEAGCAWAPEAIYDQSTGDYFVYWATISPRDGVTEGRIFYSRTSDFRTFSPPELYIERTGEGVHGGDIIDTLIIETEGADFRFYRVSRDRQLTLEGADEILGDWTRIGDISHLGFTGRQVEGPILFTFNEGGKWGLYIDRYATGGGYIPLISTDLDEPEGFHHLSSEDFDMGLSLKRHGGILNITRSEYEALLARWPSEPSIRLAAHTPDGTVVRHANYRIRVDSEVTPAGDAHWRLVPGLAEAEEGVSIRSVNFPERYLKVTASGLALEYVNDDPAAARATFIKVPGLADSEGVSFRLLDSDHYLLTEGFVLIAGPVTSDETRRRATFQIRE